MKRTRRLLVIIFTFAIAVASPANVPGEVLPLTDLFLSHEPMLGADQMKPHMEALPRGGFLAAWTAECEPENCPGGTPLAGRAFDATGAPRYPARPFTLPFLNGAGQVQFALLGPRRVAVAWENPGRDGSDRGIFGAIVDRNFREIGPEFPVNIRHTAGDQRDSTVASTGEGFIVAWQDWGDTPRVSSQRFDKSGNRLGEELDLAVYPTDYSFYPEAASLRGSRSGDVIVVWESVPLEDPEPTIDVAARFIDVDGNVSERIVLSGSDPPNTHQGSPNVAATDDGFIVAWVDGRNGDLEIYARIFDNNARGRSPAFQVNLYTDGRQLSPLVATAPDGKFVVLWTSGHPNIDTVTQDGDESGLYGQAFSADGSKIGSEFQVSTKTEGRQSLVPNTTTAAFVSDTDFVALWEDHDKNRLTSINGRRFRLSTTSRLCGDSAGADLTVSSRDVSLILRAAVGHAPCALCKCDVDVSGMVTVADAQAALRVSAGLPLSWSCPACDSHDATSR